MIIWGSIILIIALFLIVIWYLQDGVLFLFNYSRIGCLIWLLGLGLYDLGLSSLYKPNFIINILSLIVIINFGIMSKVLPTDIRKIYDSVSQTRDPGKNYKIAVIFTLGLGIVSFISNYQSGNLRFFLSNTAVKTSISMSYFLNLMVVVSLFFYYNGRNANSKRKSWLNYIFSGFALFLIFCNMSRGPLMFWATGVLIFETCRYVERRKNKYLSVKQILVLVIIALIFVWGFGAIGDFRTHSIFGGGASKYYHTPADWPSGVTWIYIYLSSPFENARYALSSISVRNYSYFNLLFYPIIKLLSNIIGMGSKYSQYVEHFDNVYPILKSGYGLNVGSFMLDAYADLNIIGILVYICMYDVIAFFIHKLMNSRKTLGISKSIMFPIIIQIAIWSVFSNSVFKIAGIWVDIIFVLIWDKCSKLKIRLGRA